MATIHMNSGGSRFASTEQPQIIVGMSAPTSGTGGYGAYQVEIGAALSKGMRAAPNLLPFQS